MALYSSPREPLTYGCWNDEKGLTCERDKCLMRRYKDNAYICCCVGDFCNGNIIFPNETTIARVLPTTTTKDKSETTRPVSMAQNSLFYISVSVLVAVVLVGVSIYVFLRRKRRRGRSHESLREKEKPLSSIVTRPVQLFEVLHKGKMSQVLKGIYMEKDVAVKVIEHQNQKLWRTEKEMFETHELRHENILLFITAEKRLIGEELQFWIITEFHTLGSLSIYLRQTVISCEHFLKMLFSIVNGLNYLHSSDPSTGKPMIAHRDIKSGNILVKNDLTCCIGDLGLAVKLTENVQVPHDLSQAGTKRYMAPEILQGAITFHQESIFYIDVYAFGLVMWELFSRTEISGVTPNEYTPPYYDLVGCHPSIDQMLDCVIIEKKRPLIASHWKDYESLELICNTMESCWEDDGDARLTMQCVYERMNQLINEPLDNLFDPSFLHSLKAEMKKTQSSSSNLAVNDCTYPLISPSCENNLATCSGPSKQYSENNFYCSSNDQTVSLLPCTDKKNCHQKTKEIYDQSSSSNEKKSRSIAHISAPNTSIEGYLPLSKNPASIVMV